MDLDDTAAHVLQDMKLSEIQHFIATVHHEAIGASLLDPLHDLEWTVLAVSGHAGELALRVKQIRRDAIDILQASDPPSEHLQQLRAEAAETLRYLVVAATLLGCSLAEFLDGAVEQARDFALDRGVDLTDIATRGGVLFKYVVPWRLAQSVAPASPGSADTADTPAQEESDP